MATPDYVRSLFDYYLWTEKLLSHTGANLESDSGEHFLVVHATEEDDDREWLSLRIPQHRLIWWQDRSVLFFGFAVDDDLQVVRFSFHFQDSHGALIWRKDNVHTHGGLSGRPHLHLRGQRQALDYDEVDLEEAIREVHEYHEFASLPRDL